MILEKSQRDGSNPRVLAQRVVEIAQELTMPYNPLDQGGSASNKTRAEIAASFRNVQPVRVSETQKLLQRGQLEQQIGVPGAGRVSPHQMGRAQMIDRVLSMQPGLTRSQAAQMVDLQLSPRSAQF